MWRVVVGFAVVSWGVACNHHASGTPGVTPGIPPDAPQDNPPDAPQDIPPDAPQGDIKHLVGGQVHGLWDGADGVALRLQADGIDTQITVSMNGSFRFEPQ